MSREGTAPAAGRPDDGAWDVIVVGAGQSGLAIAWQLARQGLRFLVLARDGVAEPNLVWKDTVLVRTGQVVDILFDVTNPGLWMAHCHIAEHMQSGMMFSFTVARQGAAR